MSSAPPIPDDLWPQVPPAAPAALVALIQHYQQRLADLEARLNHNSTNSSKPPSSDPPAVTRAPPQQPAGQKAGGQPGQAQSQRPLVERPDTIGECQPAAGRHGRPPLEGDDPQPLRHPVWDVPPLRPVITDYRRHRLPCPRCGVTTCGKAPTGQDGPRRKAAGVWLTGAYRRSKAQAARWLSELFPIPLCAGPVCATEAEVGPQLRPLVDELLTAARQQPANVDETSRGRRRWLWTIVTAVATVYPLVRGRNRQALLALGGAAYRRVLTGDRHRRYDHLAEERPQLCWAHPRRDFQALVDRGNAGSAMGQEIWAMSGQLWGWWKRVRDGTLTQVRFAGGLHVERAFRVPFRAVLRRGRVCGCARTAGTCRELWRREVALFRFAFVSGVEPTNNAAERAWRHGVLWRKQSHGPKGARGCA